LRPIGEHLLRIAHEFGRLEGLELTASAPADFATDHINCFFQHAIVVNATSQ